MVDVLAADRAAILDRTRDLWNDVRGAHVFVTGGTGFFGSWLLEALTHANDVLDLGVNAVVLTRNPERFRSRRPHLANHAAVALCPGELTTFAAPPGRFDYVIHLAAQPYGPAYHADRLGQLAALTTGTHRVLDFASHCGARRVLFASTGAVYGPQSPEVVTIDESTAARIDPVTPNSTYAGGKRFAETLAAAYAAQRGLATLVARGFSFVGPYLPLDGPFAAGNFLRDALRGGPIRVTGDGSTIRAYMYAADLAVWMWTILLRGTPGRAYNVGSDEPMSIRELAQEIALLPAKPVAVQFARTPDPDRPAERYVPAINRARQELGLQVTVPWREALRRTWEWLAPQELQRMFDAEPVSHV